MRCAETAALARALCLFICRFAISLVHCTAHNVVAEITACSSTDPASANTSVHGDSLLSHSAEEPLHGQSDQSDEEHGGELKPAIDASDKRWAANCFIRPLALVSQLSGFPNLLMLYSILCCLPVSSASAERVMSKLKLVKNRLRTSLSDDTLSALLILASERDLLMQLSTDDIITSFAFAFPSMKNHLLY
jgi:hypothetical protein